MFIDSNRTHLAAGGPHTLTIHTHTHTHTHTLTRTHIYIYTHTHTHSHLRSTRVVYIIFEMGKEEKVSERENKT